jgi:hypothetical protein
MSKPYKFKLISPSILGVEFTKESHMALMFMRLQEYTEGIKAFRGKILSEGDSLIAYLKKRKKIYYRAGWAGFNIKGSTIIQVSRLSKVVWNQYEKALFKKCSAEFGPKFDKYKAGQFYVIAYTKGDKATRKHEKLHATFYLDPYYRDKVWNVIDDNGKKKAKKYLKRMDYNFPDSHEGEYILVDEINAYAMEENSNKMRKNLGLSRKSFKELKKLAKEHVKATSKT